MSEEDDGSIGVMAHTTNGGGGGGGGGDGCSSSAANTSIYQSIDLKPGQIHEVIIRNNDPKSVLTWDFDVIKSNMHFTVFRTVKTVSHLNGKYTTGKPFEI